VVRCGSQSVWQWLAQFSTPLSRAPAGAAAEAEAKAKLQAEAQVRRACHRTPTAPLAHTHGHIRTQATKRMRHHCCSPHTAPDEHGSCPVVSSMSSHFMLPYERALHPYRHEKLPPAC
jgi:hypothetical protein